jgi:hypothetical protein
MSKTELQGPPSNGICTVMFGDRRPCIWPYAWIMDLGCRHEHISREYVCQAHRDAIRAMPSWWCNDCGRFAHVEVVPMPEFEKDQVSQLNVLCAPHRCVIGIEEKEIANELHDA